MLFSRHGEAAHNVLIARGKKEGDLETVLRGRSLFDPPLTSAGRTQAAGLGAAMAAAGISTIVTSPLQRALETTEIVVGYVPRARVVVSSLHTENGMTLAGDEVAGAPCQLGKSGEALRAAFPDWDMDGLEEAAWRKRADYEGYYHPLPVEERVEAFVSFLRDLPSAEKVVVVGHSGFYARFLDRGVKMGNCEVVEKDLAAARD